MNGQRKIKLLQCEAGDNCKSHFRILVDGASIKYLTVEPGLWKSDDMCYGPTFVTLLPELPPGDWNDGLITKDANGQPHFASVKSTKFSAVQNTWHDTFIEYTDLSIGKRLERDVYEVKCPSFDDIIIAKLARFDWEIFYMEFETTAYQWISGHDIAPRFLGHLTEHGRVIGFLMERITNARQAGVEDLETCKEVLSRLHGLGVCHGLPSYFNFLISDSKTVMISFDLAWRCDDQDLFLREMERQAEAFKELSAELEQTS